MALKRRNENEEASVETTPTQTRQTTLDEFGLKDENPNKPYWTAEQWEEWAYMLLTNFTEKLTPTEILPEWFITAAKNESE